MAEQNHTLSAPGYHWVADDRSTVRIEMDPDQAAKLMERAVAAVNALPKRGLEIGGILFGYPEVDEAGQKKLVIDGFQQIGCEHLYGPSYQLSVQDHLNWKHALASVASGREKSLPVGMFRSVTGGEFDLDDQDMAMIGDFRDVLAGDAAVRVFLILKPSRTGENLGRFAIWSADTITTLPVFTLPLARRASRNNSPSETTKPLDEEPVPSPAVSANGAGGDPSRAEAYPIGELVGNEPVGSEAVESDRPSEPEPDDEFPKIETHPTDRNVQYVRPSLVPGFRSAWIPIVAGCCVIAVALAFYLTANRRAGTSASPLFSPRGAAIDPEPDGNPADDLRSGAVFRTESNDGKGATESNAAGNPEGNSAGGGQAGGDHVGGDQVAGNQKDVNPFVEPPVAAVDSPEGGSSVARRGEPASGNAPDFDRNRPAGGVRARPAEFTMEVETPQRSHFLGNMWNTLSPMRLIRKLRGDSSTESATLTYAAPPDVPAKFRSLLRGGEHVDVRVAIDRRGKVVRAVPAKQGRGRESWLTASAVAAAYQWEFRPARISKEPVESTALLHFVFQHGSER